MRYLQSISGQLHFGKVTANAGTAYTLFIPPMGINWFSILDFLQVTTGATAHTLTIMRPLSSQVMGSSPNQVRGSTRTTVAAAASQAVINIEQDPGVYTAYFPNATPRTGNNVIAANDYAAYQCADGSWVVDTVASVSTLAITMTANVPTGGVAAGAPFWFFGISTDTNPYTASAHGAFTLAASSVVNLGDEGSPFYGTLKQGEPLLLYVNNATNASVLERCSACYSDRGSPYQN